MFKKYLPNITVLLALALSSVITWAAPVPLNNPLGLAVDPAGNLYVANFFGNAINIYNSAYTPVSAITAGIAGPQAVAVDQFDNTYVANINGGNITKYDADGQSKAVLPFAITPRSIAVDGIGNLYVAASSGNVDIYDTTQLTMGAFSSIPAYQDGDIITAVAVSGPLVYTAEGYPGRPDFHPNISVVAYNILQTLENVGIDIIATKYFQISYNPRLLHSNNQKYSSITDYYGYPMGVTGDQAGNSWTADVTNNQIWTTLIPARPKVLINLAYRPGGIALDSLRKRLFVSDPDHNSIHVYNPMTGKERRLIF